MAKASKTFHDLFLDELRDLYDAEKQLLKALPKMAKHATSDDLRSALDEHRAQTEGHVDRLERAFGLFEERPRGKHCAGIAGIIEEAGEMLRADAEDAALDAGIIAGGQRAEHYEIAAYGSVIAWAKAMGHDEAADLLYETLEEEKAADAKLSQLAETINAAATEEAGDMDESEDEEDESRTTARAEGASRPHAGARSHAPTRR